MHGIEQKMKEIQVYMNSNCLKFNPDKTKPLIMTTKNKNMHRDLKIEFESQEIEQVEFARFLGLITLRKHEME